ncbi:ADP-ribose glycohydrolase OARD1-like [Hemitrygon akajei]|uniref:ADP-ribose glycohydrolase OARD1-like n=1 Tax=Hemitrygon akajei TaxID=2704970 RepID=UPI003BF9A69B
MDCTEKAPKHNGFAISYVTGDLFQCPAEESLAHCISEDCRMGAGIAVTFRKKFQSVAELRSQKKKSGEVAVLKRNRRYIYYLITKKRAFQKPTYESLQSSLEAMKRHCINHQVTRISMPRIGCGLDKLSWNKVAERIHHVFQSTDIAITVYSLDSVAWPFQWKHAQRGNSRLPSKTKIAK